MNEPETDWTKIKWLMRHNFIVELMNKQAQRMARRAKRGKAKSGRHR